MSAKWGMFGRSFNDIGTAISAKTSTINKNFQATDDLIGSIKNSGDSIWKRLYPSKESIKSQLIDVNALYPNKTDSQFSSLLTNLIGIDEQVKLGTGNWQDYFNGLGEGEKWQIEFVQNTDLQKASLSDVKKAYSSAREAAIAHNAALQQQTLGAKAATVATKALAVAGNMLLFMAISEVISLAVTAIDDYIHRIDNLKEAAEEAKSAIDTIKSDFDSLTSTTNDVKERFAELAQGVENLGKVNQSRGTLSTDDYDEFLDLSNQLAELFPQLTKGYDDNGNAILDLSGNVDTIIGSLDNLVSVQQKLANQQILEEMPDVWSGYTANLDEYTEELDNAQKKVDGFNNSLSKIDYGVVKIKDSKTNAAIREALKKALDIDWWKDGKLYQESRTSADKGTVTWDFSTLTESQFDQLKNELGSLGSEYEDAVQLAKGKIESANSEMSSYINTWLSSEWNYSKMSSGMRNVVKDVLLNSDWINELPIDSGNWDEVSNWLQQEFLYAVNKIDSKEIQDSLIDAFNDNLSVESVENLINQLTETEGFDENNPLIIYLDTKLKDAETLQKQYEAAIEKYGEENKTTLENFFKNNSIDNSSEIDYWNDVTEGAKSAEEAVRMYNESKVSQNITSTWTGFTESQSQAIDDFQSKVKTLGDTLSSLRSGSLSNGALTDLIREFPELEGQSNNLEQAIIDLINNALQELYTTLGEGLPSDVKDDLQATEDEATGIAPALDTAFSNIQDSYDALQDFKNAMSTGMTDDVLSSVGALSSKLNELVAGFYAGTVSAEQLFEALTAHYNNDLKNYGNALIVKNQYSEEFYNAVGLASEEVVNQFMEDYGVDISNCRDYNAAKLKIEQQTLQSVSEMWSKYYDAQTQSLTGLGQYLQNQADSFSGQTKENFLEQTGFGEFLDALDEANTRYQNAIDGLNNIVYKGIGTNFDGISSKINSSSSSSGTTEEFSEEINWVEKLINKVTTALDKLKDKVSNTYLGWSVRNASLTKSMEKTQEAVEAQQQAYDTYMAKANSVGLSQDYITKVQNGTMAVEEITDEALSDMISEYETWYDKALECADAIEELKSQLAELAKQKFDNINTYFDSLMETTEASISRLENQEENSYTAHNSNLYRGLYAETQNLISYNTQKVEQLEEALDSAVNNGYIEAGSEAWRDMYNEILDVKNATDEYKLELQDISDREYEALIKPFEQKLTQLQQRKNIIDNMVSRLELQGYVAAKGLYERQLRDNESNLQTLKEQATQLQQNMQNALSNGMEVGSDEWIDMQSAIDDNVVSVMELENQILELNNAIKELEWDKFDRFQENISRITDESDFMIGLYDDDNMYDDNGRLTDEGNAVIGLHAQNYFAYREQAKAYKDEVDKINNELENDPTNTTLIDRKNDLVDAYQDATQAAYDEYQAIITLGTEGYQAQIDSIQELIDAKKEQLEADKALYEYQKSITEKTKDIADIQKQLVALANDDSEENQAKIQQLKADLDDAQKDLEETQYDKWYNDQTDMLDKLSEEYTALISEQTQDEQAIFQEMIEYANTNAQDIQNTISSTAQKWEYLFSYGIDSLLNPGINGMTDIGQNIYDEVQRLYQLNERMYRVSSDLADLGVTDYGLETTISDETTARNFIERLYNGLLGRQSDEDGMNNWLNQLTNGASIQDILDGFLNSEEYISKGKSASDTILDFYEGLLGRPAEADGYQYWMEQYNRGMSLSEIGTHGFLDSDEFMSKDFWMRLLDTNQLNTDYTELVKRGLVSIDSILLSAVPTPQISLPDYSKLSNAGIGNTSFGDININIPIEHVTDYNDLVTQLQKDTKFEKMIHDMTIGQLAGKSSLAKNNYKWN